MEKFYDFREEITAAEARKISQENELQMLEKNYKIRKVISELYHKIRKEVKEGEYEAFYEADFNLTLSERNIFERYMNKQGFKVEIKYSGLSGGILYKVDWSEEK